MVINKDLELLKELYADEASSSSVKTNILYILCLLAKVKQALPEIVLKNSSNDSLFVPFPILNEHDKKNIDITEYDLLEEPSPINEDKVVTLCKMQAGLGTSVKRDDLIQRYKKSKEIGSKGTDLFIKYNECFISLAELQLIRAYDLIQDKVFSKINFQNLVNSETEKSVDEIWDLKHLETEKTYRELFKEDSLQKLPDIKQLMAPSLRDGSMSLTTERLAPAGHGYLGFYILLELFNASNVADEIIAIGNGEDLESNPDQKIISWIAKKEIPIVMITTDKLEKDKKGGQFALVKDTAPYITIIEKAQAEKSGQLAFFEELGLREGDQKSLFNTNIVIINKKSLKNLFRTYLKISEESFIDAISPDIIKNTKEQNGKKYIQVEGALGSVMLNLSLIHI